MRTRTTPITVAVSVLATLLCGAFINRTVSAQIVPPPGEPNPNAPEELSQLAFLIGHWQAQGKSLQGDGTWEESSGESRVRYILDGYAIASTYQVQGGVGMTLFSYNPDHNRWVVEYFVPRISMLMLQAQEDVGGVQATDTSVTIVTRLPRGTLIRETYLNISEDRNEVRAERSDDGESWTLTSVSEHSRIED